MGKKRRFWVVWFVVLLAGLGFLWVTKGRLFSPRPKEINIHYSGGMSGKLDQDLRAYREGSKYYLVFEDHETGTKESYDLSKEEYLHCMQLDATRMGKTKKTYANDGIGREITLKFSFGWKKVYPSAHYQITPCFEMEFLQKKKQKGEEISDLERIDGALMRFFCLAGFENAKYVARSILGSDRGTAYNVYGNGYDVFEKDVIPCKKDILDELVTELALQKLYDDKLLEERTTSLKDAKALIEKKSGTSFETYVEEELLGNPTLSELRPSKESLIGLITYLHWIMTDSDKLVHRDSKAYLLQEKFEHVEKNGREAYVRTLRGSDQIVCLAWFPKEEYALVTAADVDLLSPVWMAEPALKQIMTSLGEESVSGEAYAWVDLGIRIAVCVLIAFVIAAAQAVLLVRKEKTIVEGARPNGNGQE